MTAEKLILMIYNWDLLYLPLQVSRVQLGYTVISALTLVFRVGSAHRPFGELHSSFETTHRNSD